MYSLQCTFVWIRERSDAMNVLSFVSLILASFGSSVRSCVPENVHGIEEFDAHQVLMTS